MTDDERSYDETESDVREALESILRTVRSTRKMLRESTERILKQMSQDRAALDAAIQATGNRVAELVKSLEEKISLNADDPEDFSAEIGELNGIAAAMQSGSVDGQTVPSAPSTTTAAPAQPATTVQGAGGAQGAGTGEPGANPSAVSQPDSNPPANAGP